MRSRARGLTRPGPLRLAMLAALLLGVPAARAQEVRLAERPRTDAQRALEVFLERGGYAVWTRDTVLARGDTVRGHLLVLEASVRIAGRVEGDIYVVDGDLFLRTRGSVGGDVVVLGGGFYDSDLATVEGAITYRPNERVRVRPTQGAYEVIHEVEALPAFEADGTRGIQTPTYQRVDAWTFGLGGLVRATAVPGRPELEASARFKTGPDQGEVSGRASIYPSDRLRLGLAAGRRTRTLDGWIRPTWYNGLAHLLVGDDDRDYYQAEEARVELEWVSAEPPVWEDAPSWSLSLSAGAEEARSLPARDVWTLFGEDATTDVPSVTDPVPYPNPEVDEGVIFFGRAGFEWSKRGREGRAAFGLGLEAGFDDDLVGDFDFVLAEARLAARRATSWGHAWELFAIARADVAGTLPRQRHSTIGGVGTIATMPLRGMRGPRLLYGEATYAVPVLGMAELGGLDAFLRVSAGSAWGEDRAFRLEETVAGGLAVRLWDFQMELGVAAGSTAGPADNHAIPYFDVRVRRSARPAQMPRGGRGF